MIHLRDESYGHDITPVYYLEKCIFVFREYFRPNGGIIHLLKDFSKSFFFPTYYHNRRSFSGYKLLASKIKHSFLSRFYVFKFMKRQYLPRLPSTEKIFHIPLGYTDKAAKSWMNESNPEGDRTARHYSHNQKITERKYKWSFCGQSSKQDRKLMLQCLKNCHPNFIFETDRTGQNKSLSGKDYWEIMTQSIFIPSPIGNINVDCYRLFESLEAGAIPIILKGTAYQPYDYYKNLLGHHPIPTFSSWRGVEIFLENINVASIQEISEKVSQWYKSYKLNLKIKIQEVMSKLSMGKLLSEDHHLITFINASQE